MPLPVPARPSLCLPPCFNFLPQTHPKKKTPKGAELHAALSASWGVLASRGHCYQGRCQRFPVVVGEMGSRLASAADIQYYASALPFMRRDGAAAAADTAPVAGWFWWSWNANSKGE
jgi:hypothetical protein